MIPLTIKHLRYFDSLARHGHFGRAAEACAISQPALSLQMKELEDILGTPLIERGTRQISLTPLGESFAARARDILRAVDELDAEKLSPLLKLRYGALNDAIQYLGEAEQIRQVFVGFQRYLYESNAGGPTVRAQ